MNNYTYHFEIKDLLTQFAAAFDDVVIKRYNKDRVAEQSINVRYVLAPKQRVMYDIVNKAQNLTLPVIAMNVTSIARDNNRIFNKLDKLYNYKDEKKSTFIGMPVPVNIEVSVSILARYMQDMDQILSNFIPYSNPYVIISHKEPNSTQDTVEIRTEVNWSGSINMTSPTDMTYSDKFRVVADTNFTIKGWLFKDTNTVTPPIFNIKFNGVSLPPNFNLETLDDSSDNYQTLTNSLSYNTSFNTISGTPYLTDLFLFTGSSYIRMFPPYTISGNISGTGDSYGIGGTYGRGSSVGVNYGPGGEYTDSVVEEPRENSSGTLYDYSSFRFNKPGGYSSGKGNLESGGNYLVTGNNLSQISYLVLSANDITKFYSLLMKDILINPNSSSYLFDLTTNTNLISSLGEFLQNPHNTSLLTNLTSMSSFYAFVNIFNSLTIGSNVFTTSLSSIPGALNRLSSYPATNNSITSKISCFNINTTQICGYFLPKERYTALNDSIVTINIPIISSSVIFDIVIITSAGWVSTRYIENKSTCCNC